MLTVPETRYFTPEVLMDLPWEVTNPAGFEELKGLASSLGLKLFDKPKAIRGGKILKPKEVVGDEKETLFVASDRTIAVVPARSEGSHITDKVIFFPSEKVENRPFSANFSAYQGDYASFVSKRWKDLEFELGRVPFAGAVQSEFIDEGRWATVLNYREKLQGLGKGGFQEGIHVLDSDRLSEEEARRMVRVIDAVHLPSFDFQNSPPENYQNIDFDSWMNPTGEGEIQCFRGQEWWIDRISELQGKLNISYQKGGETVRDIFKRLYKDFDVDEEIDNMIRNNLPLYPHVDGEIDNERLVGNLVVAHGTLYPDNIHTSLNSSTGKLDYTITGGDRSQFMGLRGQEIDWLVASAGAKPEFQKILISEFLNLQQKRADVNTQDKRYFEKERRGLAMHVLYRCISESEWFMKNREGSTTEVENLARLAHDILIGDGSKWDGAWDNVNTSMQTN